MHVRGSAPAEQIMEVVRAARDILTVRRVFGEAYVSGETTVIPVAKVTGGSGMGYGGSQQEAGDDGGSEGAVRDGGSEGAVRQAAGSGSGGGFEGEGGGGGLGVRVEPLGVYVVRGGDVQWQPALDVNRLAIGGQMLVAVALLAWAFHRRGRG
ncbi:hypothetical protein ATJ97_1254 [Georgenia soli]|uniref:Sporulation protein YtfJ n=1 Tax=Georgenia soli TaxID=638953 RepID=A0A2A9EI60_9MICO|nr:hypothetical protein [Georgenia soli]PFG38767.1 hypothetical protein ATJ97_1254 [Georgenia soli]